MKVVGILIGGIFVGAVGMEIVRQKCPRLQEILGTKFSAVSAKLGKLTAGVREAFQEGYQSTAKPDKANA